MENMNNIGIGQLEDMKNEMQELRESLQQQKIFTDKSIRHAMVGRSSWINRFVKSEVFIVLPVSILLFLWLKSAIGLSWAFVVVTLGLIFADIVWDIIINRLKPADYVSLSLIDLKERLIRQREMRRRQMLIEVPLIVVWAVWFVYDVATNGVGMYEDVPFWIPLIITVVWFIVAMVIVFKIYHKMQGIDADALAEIEQLKNME